MPPPTMSRSLRLVPTLAVLALVAATFAVPPPAAASAQGGATAPSNGGLGYGEGPEAPTPQKHPRTSSGPTLAKLTVPRRLYLYGRGGRITFRIDDDSSRVRAWLDVVPEGERKATRRIALGTPATGSEQTFVLRPSALRGLGQGSYRLRAVARDPDRNLLRRARGASVSDRLGFYWHRFPLVGRFDYGAEGSRFGAPRSGHSHQGQDLSAAEGVPVVAPRGGRIETVAYQAGGAGNYIVLDGSDEDRDYIFMHLQTGSNRVRVGQRVFTGQRLASVGNTGSSSGAHLHFEIWVGGGWYTGGHPVDPLPYLRAWDRWS